MEIKMFSFSYFMYLAIAIGCIIGSWFLIRKRSERFQRRFIAGLLFLGLVLHFSKLLFPPYNNDTYALRKISPENICAVSVLAFPFIFLSKRKYLKDYMFFIGVVSGFGAILIPAEAFGKSPFIYDTIRFYLVHMIISIAPLLMVLTKLHKIDYRRNWAVPLIFIGVLGIILINEVILFEVGLLDGGIPGEPDPWSPANPYNPNDLPLSNPSVIRWRNFSMIFGPAVTPQMMDSQAFIVLDKFLSFFTPRVFLEIPSGPNAGQPKYWPLLWVVFPAIILLNIWCFLVSLIWEHKRIKADVKKFGKFLKDTFKISKKPVAVENNTCENGEDNV